MLIEELPGEDDGAAGSADKGPGVSVECTASGAKGPARDLLNAVSYGFGNRYTGMFLALRDELFDLVELPDPDRTPEADRRSLREAHEDAAFDWQRYGSDACAVEDGEDPLILEAMTMRPHWHAQQEAADNARRPPGPPSASAATVAPPAPADPAGASYASDACCHRDAADCAFVWQRVFALADVPCAGWV